MPINYKNYPPNWTTEIRPRIQARAGNRCEKCGVPNGVLIWRDSNREAHVVDQATVDLLRCAYPRIVKIVRVVCTVAHVYDEDPHNAADDNLAFWCQQCHNAHDAKRRALRRKAKQQTLPITSM